MLVQSNNICFTFAMNCHPAVIPFLVSCHLLGGEFCIYTHDIVVVVGWLVYGSLFFFKRTKIK